MSEKKYTPGPWIFVYEPETNGSRPFTVKGDEYYLADIYSDVSDGEANARLTVCAPELLEALEESLMWHQGDKWGYGTSEERVIWEDWKTKLEHLIAKAKGSDALAIPKE